MNKKLFSKLEEYGAEPNDTITRLGIEEEDYISFLKMFFIDETINKLEQYVVEHNDELAEREAHTIKGVALNLGILPLVDLCTDMVYLYRQKKAKDAVELFPEIKENFYKAFAIIKDC